MQIYKSVIVGFSVLLLSQLGACEQSAPPLKIKVGQVLPIINARDLHGNKTTLQLATGKIILLNVWATWCGPCRHEMPSLDRLVDTLDQKKFTVVGLSVDTDDYVVREFLIERKVGFRNYMDADMEIANQIFGIRAFPSTLVFGPDGQLLEVIEGWREWDSQSMIEKLRALETRFG